MSRTFFGKFAVVGIATLLLSACIQSKAPLITDAQPLLGQQFEVHLYEDFVDNKASGLHASAYQWKDDQYVRLSGLARTRSVSWPNRSRATISSFSRVTKMVRYSSIGLAVDFRRASI